MKKRQTKTTPAKRITPPTPAEDAAINAQIAADPDDSELPPQWFQNAKPTKDLFPQTYQKAMQQKTALETGALQQIQITLPADVINWFKSQTSPNPETGGTAWLDLIEQTLTAHARPAPNPAVAANPNPAVAAAPKPAVAAANPAVAAANPAAAAANPAVAAPKPGLRINLVLGYADGRSN